MYFQIYGWIPELYEASSLPADMSADLQDYIKALPEEEVTPICLFEFMIKCSYLLAIVNYLVSYDFIST